jgi:hypothetical protein
METTLLPITVIVAITIFVIKEALEHWRKYQSHQRQILAIKHMLADEIEKNNYTIAALRRTLVQIKEKHDKYEISLNRTPSGSLRIEFKEEVGGYGPSWPIPNVSRVVFDKTFVQLASLDLELFNKAKDAYESISEVEHVRNSLIDHLEEQEWHPKDLLVAFAEYGIDELVDAYINLSKLYKDCTGNDLDKHKLRAFA